MCKVAIKVNACVKRKKQKTGKAGGDIRQQCESGCEGYTEGGKGKGIPGCCVSKEGSPELLGNPGAKVG